MYYKGMGLRWQGIEHQACISLYLQTDQFRIGFTTHIIL